MPVSRGAAFRLNFADEAAGHLVHVAARAPGADQGFFRGAGSQPEGVYRGEQGKPDGFEEVGHQATREIAPPARLAGAIDDARAGRVKGVTPRVTKRRPARGHLVFHRRGRSEPHLMAGRADASHHLAVATGEIIPGGAVERGVKPAELLEDPRRQRKIGAHR